MLTLAQNDLLASSRLRRVSDFAEQQTREWNRADSAVPSRRGLGRRCTMSLALRSRKQDPRQHFKTAVSRQLKPTPAVFAPKLAIPSRDQLCRPARTRVVRLTQRPDSLVKIA